MSPTEPGPEPRVCPHCLSEDILIKRRWDAEPHDQFEVDGEALLDEYQCRYYECERTFWVEVRG